MILALLSLSPAIDPAFAKNITVFHVNEHQFGPIPLNMNTGDALGDMFFDISQVINRPLKCPNGSATPDPPHGPNICKNPEAGGDDLRTNKLTLEVDRRFSGYAECNVCVNGSTILNGTCPTGANYSCRCTEGFPPRPIPCNATVGEERVIDKVGHYLKYGCQDSDPPPNPADCFDAHLIDKMEAPPQRPGLWFSTLDVGYCGASGSACTWRVVSVDKVVRRTCHVKVFGEAVQAAGDPACLDGCGDQRHNASSPCWTSCFLKAAVGPDAGRPGGAVAGMTLDALTSAWQKPFLPEDQGGCPPAY